MGSGRDAYGCGVGQLDRAAGYSESIDQKELEYPKPRIVFKVFQVCYGNSIFPD